MAQRVLVSDRFALVDDEDFAKVGEHRWYLHTGGYAMSVSSRTTLYMHRFILDAPKGTEVDHINGNKLDNRRCNLRLASRSQNEQNKSLTTSKTGVRGVTYLPGRAKPYRVQIYLNRQRLPLGYYRTLEEAAAAVTEARKKHHSHSFLHRPKGGAR